MWWLLFTLRKIVINFLKREYRVVRFNQLQAYLYKRITCVALRNVVGKKYAVKSGNTISVVRTV